MAVAHKGSISMGLVLIPVGLYKPLWTMIFILINCAGKASSGYSIKSIADIVIRK